MQKKDKINLDEIIGDFIVKNTPAFHSYLKQLWNDLSKREKSIKNGIDRISFGKYYVLPGLISERLFSVFDSRNKGYLTMDDFTNSMIKLFSGDYEQLLNFIFDFYDFDKDNKITKEDIRIVLSYVPLYKKISEFIFCTMNLNSSKFIICLCLNKLSNFSCNSFCEASLSSKLSFSNFNP